jgi:hypothetical protein
VVLVTSKEEFKFGLEPKVTEGRDRGVELSRQLIALVQKYRITMKSSLRLLLSKGTPYI